jgi:hypothetical protein
MTRPERVPRRDYLSSCKGLKKGSKNPLHVFIRPPILAYAYNRNTILTIECNYNVILNTVTNIYIFMQISEKGDLDFPGMV